MNTRIYWKTRMVRSLPLIVVLCGLLLPSIIASAAVTWDPSTRQQVYNPGTSVNGTYYAYAPSVIVDGNTEHIWTCHNKDSGVIRDHIFYTKRVNGAIVSSRPVLVPSASGWDSYHNCDPSVVRGQFRYNGATYAYALFYLGNDVNASYHNQIGVAFATSVAGPWVKYPHPLVTYPNNGDWGVGQPSAISVDGKGRLLLFYTQGASTLTTGFRRELALSDMARPSIGVPLQLTTAGLTDVNGQRDYLNNFDVVYDPSRDRFYAVREQHPYPTDNPTYIGASLQIASIPAAHIWRGGGHWTVEGTITPALTGFPRNHNAGFERSPYGTLPNPNALRVVYTVSCSGRCNGGRPEWTYALWSISGTLARGGRPRANGHAGIGQR